MRALRTALLLALALPLVGGTAGALHPAGDSLAAFRPHLALALLAAGIPASVAGPRILGAAAAILAVAALVPLAWPRLAPPPAGPFSVYQKNLSHDLRDVSAAARDIEAARPDVVLLQEVTPRNEALLARLAPSYRAGKRCPSSWLGDTAVLSRHPMVPGTGRCVLGAAVLRVSTPDGPLWLASAHLRWPWPVGQAAQAEALSRAPGAFGGPVVLGGDLNMVPWSRAVMGIARETGSRHAGPARATLRIAGVLPIAIDHVLAPGGGRTERRPRLGSDHHGLLARVDPWAGLSGP